MAINRYEFTKKMKEKDCYGTTRYPEFPKKSTDLYIISREGDRLDNLAYEFYEDPRYWWILAEANKLGHGTLNVPPGLQLRIPLPILDLTNRLREAEENR
jgi:nucleoid-associated protein YgaU